ncbi:MAG: hypothetical protein J6B30_05745 [Muribaculaceae bacterium]|nr:hypothetical protein [Muribaculaceae bacterium]
MMFDEKLPLNEWKAYNDSLNAIIANPKEYGFDNTIIPVCQFLAYFCPVNPPCNNFANMTTVQIISELDGIVDVDINTVCRLMLALGYKIYYKGSPEWSMMRAGFEE